MAELKEVIAVKRDEKQLGTVEAREWKLVIQAAFVAMNAEIAQQAKNKRVRTYMFYMNSSNICH